MTNQPNLCSPVKVPHQITRVPDSLNLDILTDVNEEMNLKACNKMPESQNLVDNSSPSITGDDEDMLPPSPPVALNPSRRTISKSSSFSKSTWHSPVRSPNPSVFSNGKGSPLITVAADINRNLSMTKGILSPRRAVNPVHLDDNENNPKLAEESSDEEIECLAVLTGSTSDQGFTSSQSNSIGIPAAQPRPNRSPTERNGSDAFIGCLETQDLFKPKPAHLVELDLSTQASSVESPSMSCDLPAAKNTNESFVLNYKPSGGPHSSSSRSPGKTSHSPVRAIARTNQSNDETVERISSQENFVEEEWLPFEAAVRVYNPVDRSWTLRTFHKMIPVGNVEQVISASISDHLVMGHFDNMSVECLSGSRHLSFAELLQKQAQNSSNGYIADMSASLSLRSSRFSIASSTLDIAPVACSSLLSCRASIDSCHILKGHREFSVPKLPAPSARHPDAPTASITAVAMHAEGGERKADGTETASTGAFEDASGTAPANAPLDCQQQEDKRSATGLEKRKRGRQPKIPSMIPENESSVVSTPQKKGRPPATSQPDAPAGVGAKPSSALSDRHEPSNLQPVSKPPSEHCLEDGHLKGCKRFDIGQPVFAQWTDKFYYAAIIAQRDPIQSGKWSVQFEDGQSRSLIEEFILPFSILTKRQPVLVLNESLCEGRAGVVVGFDKSSQQHIVEMDGSETLKVPRKRICMTQDQLKLWNESLVVPQLFSPRTCNVSLDNIVDGKRERRRATTCDSKTSSPRTPRSKIATSSGNASRDTTPKRSVPSPYGRKAIRKRDVVLDSSTLSEGSSGTSLLECAEQTRIIRRATTASILTTSGRPRDVDKEDDGMSEPVDVAITGPLPTTDVFAGFALILTKATHQLRVDDEDDDDLQPYLSPTPYYKEYIARQLIAGGGCVLDRFDQSQLLDEGVTVLVICNRPCRTERYIRSLAANIRAVSHDWVYQCSRKGEQIPYTRYLLPPGIDLRGRIVEWSSRTGRCFAGKRILVNGPPGFNDLWVPILVQAECIIVSRMPQIGSSAPNNNTGCVLSDDVPVDFVVTTKDCSDRIVQQATRMQIPLCSSLWVILSLVHGKILDPSSEPEFGFRHAEP